MTTDTPNPNRRRWVARLKLIFIILLFAGPLATAFLGYYGPGFDVSTRGQSNHAPLIEPPVALQAFSNDQLSGAAINRKALGRKWSLIHIVSAPCAERCQRALYQTRQTRLAVGRHAGRIQRYIIVRDGDATGTEPVPGSLISQLMLNHPDAILLKPGTAGVETQMQRLETPLAGDDAVLVDPVGNMMMVVPVDLESRLLLKDLKKLLKLSRIG